MDERTFAVMLNNSVKASHNVAEKGAVKSCWRWAEDRSSHPRSNPPGKSGAGHGVCTILNVMFKYIKVPVFFISILALVLACPPSEAEKLPRVLGAVLGASIKDVENEYERAGIKPLYRSAGSITYTNLLDPLQDERVVMVSYLHHLGNLHEIRVAYDNRDIFLDLFLKLNPEYGSGQVVTGASAVVKGEAKWEKGRIRVVLRKVRDDGAGATILIYSYRPPA